MLSAGFIFIALYCYFMSLHKPLWSDELFGWMLITDSSWHHMLFAWREGADGGGLMFYLFARLWFDLSGHTVLDFRAFSAACCFVGLAAMWFALRRYYGVIVSFVAVFAVWFGSQTILWQMIQTRFYGMMLGATSLALFAAVRNASDADTLHISRKSTLALTAIANLMLVGSHPFGVLYSSAILAGAGLSDILVQRRRIAFYIAAILPWTLLLASREAMVNSAKVGKPHFWTTQPHSLDLINLYAPPAFPNILLLVLILLPTATVLLFSAAFRERILSVLRERGALLIPGVMLALFPFPIWLVSQHGTSYFVDRYLLPFTLGIAVLTGDGLSQIYDWQSKSAKSAPKVVFAVLAAALICQAGVEVFVKSPVYIQFPPRDFTPSLAAQLPRGLPIVIERVDVFDMMLASQPAPDLPLYHLLDWETAIAPESPRDIISGYHEMENWKKVGYFSGSIMQSDEFLQNNKRFVVVDDQDVKWFERRVLGHPEWLVTPIRDNRIGMWSANEKIWMVERR